MVKNTNGNHLFGVVPISSRSNFFGSGVRLRLLWPAAFSSAWCLRIQRITFSPSRSGIAFYSNAFLLSIRFTWRFTFGDGVIKRIRQNSSPAIRVFTVRNHPASRLLDPPESQETCVSVIHGLQLNLLKNDVRFFEVDQLAKIALVRLASDSSVVQTRRFE